MNGEDTWHDNYEDAPADGRAWLGDSDRRVVRGGSWGNSAGYCRAAYRSNGTPGNRDGIISVRVVCVPRL